MTLKIGCVRPFVVLNQLTFDLHFFVCAFVVTVLARRRLKVKVKLLGQCRWSVQMSVVSAESYKY